MGISAGQLDTNTKHIHELAQQIRYNSDCGAVLFQIEQHLGSVKDLMADIRAEQAKLLAQVLPMAKPPKPTPTSIVSWIKKLTTGLITPQLKANILYAKKLIQMAAAVAEVAAAVSEARSRLPHCLQYVEDSLLDDLQNELNSMVSDALSEVAAAQTAIRDVIEAADTVASIDVSSPEAFLNSVDDAEASINQAVDTYQASPLPD